MPLVQRDVPKIGGSVAGFYALITGLAVVTLLCSVGIVWLLRDNAVTSRDRQTPTNSRYQSSSVKSRAAWATNLSLGGLFRSHSTRGGHGWIQASGDAWEADEADRRASERDAPFQPPPVVLNDPYDDKPEPSWFETRSYSSDYSLAPDSTSRHPTRVRPESGVTGSDWESASAAMTDPESGHAEDAGHATQQRHFSLDSAVSDTSVRTFQGGTKFLEGL
ncbi:hypothetical protein FB45DRAFT_930749 [Roridomyces roridus]|uniref:Uncharacterized protein n=1 Tax=Roridomyces roridus TaxID=1738132 RepID=A0AAD7FGV4_9AGAR|nr:hypothetical protein FB45DRAFT_930749 [Roridomyces roridus]